MIPLSRSPSTFIINSSRASKLEPVSSTPLFAIKQLHPMMNQRFRYTTHQCFRLLLKYFRQLNCPLRSRYQCLRLPPQHCRSASNASAFNASAQQCNSCPPVYNASLSLPTILSPPPLTHFRPHFQSHFTLVIVRVKALVLKHTRPPCKCHVPS